MFFVVNDLMPVSRGSAFHGNADPVFFRGVEGQKTQKVDGPPSLVLEQSLVEVHGVGKGRVVGDEKTVCGEESVAEKNYLFSMRSLTDPLT